MVVLILTACPTGLRGYLTRWLLEVSPGVFVGHVTARVRDLLWQEVTANAKDGRAIMVHSVRVNNGSRSRCIATTGNPPTSTASTL